MFSSGKIPSSLACYRLRFEAGRVCLPEGYPLTHRDLTPNRFLPRREVAGHLRAQRPRDGRFRDLERCLGQLALLGLGSGGGGLLLLWEVVPPGPWRTLGLFLGSWVASLWPLFFQSSVSPLEPLGPEEFSRRDPVVVEKDGTQSLVLLVRSGDLAAALARWNGIVPEPVAGNGGECSPRLSPWRGVGRKLAAGLGICFVILALLVS
jgi:hypothetical protein